MKLLLWLAFVGLALRALVPVGYMPASLADGGPIRLCHGGLSPAFLQTLDERDAADADASPSALHDKQRHHANGGDGERDGWAHCPVGTIVSLAALAADVDVGVLGLEHALAVGGGTDAAALSHQRLYHARAPPRSRLPA